MRFQRNKWSGQGNVFYAVCSIILAIILGILLWNEHVKSEKEKQELQLLNKELTAQRKEEEQARRLKEENDSFYQKLEDGFDVNILIVGDSIGAGAGTKTAGNQWFEQLKSYLRKEYGIRVGMTNVSMGGNASYAGYVRVMALEDEEDYDLAILCYGQNDSPDGFEKTMKS